MNEYLRKGLLMQIPNFVCLFGLLILYMFFIISWDWFSVRNVSLIIIGTLYGLFNIFSIILITIGLTTRK